jgi:hypothetical protein
MAGALKPVNKAWLLNSKNLLGENDLLLESFREECIQDSHKSYRLYLLM